MKREAANGITAKPAKFVITEIQEAPGDIRWQLEREDFSLARRSEYRSRDSKMKSSPSSNENINDAVDRMEI